jgi:hypothetical protein
MKYNTDHGQPSRLAIDAAQITPTKYKEAMTPEMGHASCKVVETGQYTNKGVKSLDIQYDCDTNNLKNSHINRGSEQVSSQWQKGSTQTPNTVKGGWVINDNEGQCLRPNPLAGDPNNKVLCEHKETNKPIRENENYAKSDCKAANVAVGTCRKEYDPDYGQDSYVTQARTESECTAEEGTWTPAVTNCVWEEVQVHQQCHPDNNNLSSDFANVADRETCRTMECNSTACGPTTGTLSYHAKVKDNNLTECIANTKGGVVGTIYTCTPPTLPLDFEFRNNYDPITVAEMTKSAPTQFGDGVCYGSTKHCDNCGFLWAGDSCSGDPVIRHKGKNCDGWNNGGYESCVYDLDNAPDC